MSRNRFTIGLALVVILSVPGWSADYNDNILGINPLSIACLIGTLIPSASAGINVTDEWSYQTTNAQSIIGTIGFLSMACNFVSAWYFYRKTEQDLARVLQTRKDELQNNDDLYQREEAHYDHCALQIEQYIAKKQRSLGPIKIPNSNQSSSSDSSED